MFYAYKLKKTNDGYVAEVPDLGLVTKPQATEDEASGILAEGLSAAVETGFRSKGKPIPLPSAPCGELALYVPVKLQLRILFWNAMLDHHLKQTEVASMMGISKAVVNQMVSGKSAVSVERYEEGLNVLGLYPDVRLHGQEEHALQLEGGKKGD